MAALRGVERAGGTPAAFFGGDARMGDVLWVSSYRANSSFVGFTPHITLGHAEQPPVVERMSFQASTRGGVPPGPLLHVPRDPQKLDARLSGRNWRRPVPLDNSRPSRRLKRAITYRRA